MEDVYGYIDDVLYEFDGQLKYHDILNMTYKEIGYLMKHRKALKEKLGPTMKDLRLK